MFSTRKLLDDHMRECERRAGVTDRKLDKIEGKVETALKTIIEGVERRHEQNQELINAIDQKLDSLPWKILGAAGTVILFLAGMLFAIVKTKVGL